MPVFEIEANGKTFEVDAPDIKAASAAVSARPGVLADIVKSAPDAVVSGLSNFAGSPGDAINFLTRKGNEALGGGGRNLSSLITGESAAAAPTEMTGLAKKFNDFFGGSNTYTPGPSRYADTGDYKKAAEGVTGELPKPQTSAGKIVHSSLEAASNPLSYAGPGGALMKTGSALLSGAGSEGAGQATEGTKAEPYARIAGALLAPMAPTAAGRIITPAPATAARQRLVNILEDEGVTSLTAGQRTGNESLRYAESTLGNAPFSGQPANRITREGQEQFTEAAMRRTGAGPNASPDVLAANNQRLGNEFETLSARNTLQMDPQFANDIRTVIRDYARVLPSEQRERIYNIITDLAQQGNAIPGNVYQATRSRLSRSANNNRASDPDYADALRGIRNALDEAMGRSIAPADQAAWQTARREYGAQKTVEKAASKAGELTAEGQITPANLRNTVSAANRGAYARGEGDFSELSRAGAGVMAPMPQSGTAPRSAFYNIANMLSMGVIPASVGRVLMSRPVQGYLSNQAAAPALNRLNPRQSAIVGALLAAEQQQQPQLNMGPR